MNELAEALYTSPLFKGFGKTKITDLLLHIRYKVTDYSKDRIIALEGENASSIGVIIEGSVEIQRTYPSGRSITIDRLYRGDIFGEAIIFSSSKRYPATIISAGNSKVFFLSEGDILRLCATNQTFLNNFMRLLSNKVLMLNQRLKKLSYQTIREKVASYLTEEYKNQKSPVIKTFTTRKEMAELFGITRPSLSRELISMKKDGLIDFDKSTITIKNIKGLEDILF